MNKESILYIDMETKDDFIKMKLGAGWVFKYHTNTDKFKILGCAVKSNDGESRYITDWNELATLMSQHDAIAAHNATYELGILKVLEKDYPAIRSSHKKIYDTKLLYKLFNNQLQSYSLDSLAKQYLNTKKGYNILADIVWNNGLYPWTKTELTAKTKAEVKGIDFTRVKPTEAKLTKFAYEHMDLLQEVAFEEIAKYAVLDVELCHQLLKKVLPNISTELQDTYSTLVHICVDYRLRGVRIDLEKARELSDELLPKIMLGLVQINNLAGSQVNIRSPKELPIVFDKLGIRYPLSDKGNPSITTPWLKKQKHEICKLIVDVRNNLKLQGDFFKKIIDMQEYACPNATKYGMLFPELNILEATTGRFSSTNPNIQQQPEFVRQIFVPFEGEQWHSLDFSNQEGRLQIHYAKQLNCDGIDEFIEEFKKNPQFDMHYLIIKLLGLWCGNDLCEDPKQRCSKCKESRSIAKTINLGLSYGMGLAKLGIALGLSEEQAKLLRGQYNTSSPFLAQLISTCTSAMKDRGYIKTIGGRLVRISPSMTVNGKEKTFEYKALNSLCQGSANDQTTNAMIQCYKEGLPILFPVHDELCMSGTLEQAKRVKEIMEHAVELVIPSFTEIKSGNTWAECK